MTDFLHKGESTQDREIATLERRNIGASSGSGPHCSCKGYSCSHDWNTMFHVNIRNRSKKQTMPPDLETLNLHLMNTLHSIKEANKFMETAK